MLLGRFRSCSCDASIEERKWLFEEKQSAGHRMGPFTVLIHEPGCLGMKGGNRAKVWLMRLKKSAKGRFEFNDYVHPDAHSRGELDLSKDDQTALEDAIAQSDWNGVRNLITGRLGRIQRLDVLSHFPTTKKAS